MIVGAREDPPDSADETVEYVFTSKNQKFRSLVGVAVFIGSCAVAFAWLNRPHEVLTPRIVATGQPVALMSSQPSPTAIVVDVEGKVMQPGLQTLPVDARVADAIAAAGGFRHGVTHTDVNLAAHVTDGQLIAIGITTSAAGVAGSTGSGSGGTGSKVNINTAAESDFEGLPGVGPVLANRMLQWRQTHGLFGSINDLQDIPGIGPKVFANLSAYITVS
jgi:competence protein ComEA